MRSGARRRIGQFSGRRRVMSERDAWVNADANPNASDEGLLACIAAGMAAMNGWPGRGEKFEHSATMELAKHDERVRREAAAEHAQIASADASWGFNEASAP